MTTPNNKVRIGIAGLSHDHVFWIMRNLNHPNVEVVGFYEPDRDLAARYAARVGFDMGLVYSDLGQMLDATHPAAVAAFGSIFDHRMVVEACAPRGVHVMVEKPLAVNMEHAAVMADLARQHHIHLLTNYETSWYASTYAAYEMVRAGKIGEIRKVVVHDGHFGPKEIGCSPDFLAWLTDPVLNGGGAIIDFGCYGACLITWLLGGEMPQSVVAVTQTLKPDVYPKVDDEATAILSYPHAQGIIQGSWNWPLGRKDIEIYGQSGYIIAEDATHLRVRQRKARQGTAGREYPDLPEERITLEPLSDPRADPFAYLAGVVRGEIVVEPGGLYSLENGLAVVQILDLARESARTGSAVRLPS